MPFETITGGDALALANDGSSLTIYDWDGNFIGLYEVKKDAGDIKPVKLFFK